MTNARTVLAPYGGGKLKDLVARDAAKSAELAAEAANLPYIVLSDRELCDLEMISNGGFSPLEGFMTREEYLGVVHEMKLPTGEVWPIPIYLDVDPKNYFSNGGENTLEAVEPSNRIALRDPRNQETLAILTVSDKYTIDKQVEAEKVYGTLDDTHPAVGYLMHKTSETVLGGKVEVIKAVQHEDFVELRKTPAETRSEFASKGWERVVAFQTRNPMHRAHLELTMRASDQAKANVFVHPVVGMTKPGDVDYTTRVNVYRMIMHHYPENSAYLSLLPLAMRMGGPKEAILHAIIRRNYGASHFIVGRDHAGPGKDRTGRDFYEAYEAQELVTKYKQDLGIEIVLFSMVTYLPEEGRYEEIHKVPKGTQTLTISGTELRNRLVTGEDIPDWFSFDNVVKVLRAAYA